MQREFKCGNCGTSLQTWGGDDVDCPRCGQWHNAFGQQVNYPIFDSPCAPSGFDPSYAGERWDDDY